MGSVYEYLLSDMDFLEAIRNLSSKKYEDDSDSAWSSDEGYTVQRKLNIVIFINFIVWYILIKMEPILIIRFPGMIFNGDKEITEIQWLKEVEGKVGEGILIPMHTDDWGLRTQKPVISFVRKIIGDDRGYIEVQMDQEHLDEWFSDESGSAYVFLTNEGDLIYSSDDSYDSAYYKDLILDHINKSTICQKEDSKGQICMAARQTENGVVAAVLSENASIFDTVKSIIPVSLLILAMGILVSLAYIEISTGMITKPLKILKEYIKIQTWRT